MNKSLRHSRSSTFALRYHLLWCTKYRQKVLTPDIAKDLYDILYNVASDYDFDIVAMSSNVDHVHMLIDCTPKNYIPDIVGALKGKSSRILRQLHADALPPQGTPLWSPSYFIRTISDVDQSKVQAYIESQGDE